LGYATSRRTVIRMLGHLKVLEKRATIQFAAENPSRLAYAIREALFAAQFYPDFIRFKELRKKYRFEVREGCVIARYEEMDKSVDEFEFAVVDAKVIGETAASRADDLGALAQEALSTATLPGVSTLDAVIGGTIKYSPQCEEVYFPDAILTENEKERLFRWAVGEGWKIIDNEEDGITLTQKGVPEAIVWKPSDQPGSSK
jgi:hypothetical protein